MPKTEVLVPLLWIMVFCFLAATGTAYSGTIAADYFLKASLAVLGYTMLIYTYLFIFDRDRLQSEEYMKHLLGDDRRGKIAIEASPTSANNVSQMSASAPTVGVQT